MSWTTFIYPVIALVILGLIWWGLAGRGGFLVSLADKEVARGLITFLIAITTVGIAVILMISTITGDPKDGRFDEGKQVLASLIGVLGTIVGFYFGATKDTKSGQATTLAGEQQELAIAPARLSNAQPKKGEKITISSFIWGGKPPYAYSITFDSVITSIIKDKPSPDGSIKEEVTIPETLDGDKDVKYQIFVKDADGKTADYNTDGSQKIAVKMK